MNQRQSADVIGVLADPGKAGVANPGAHGFSEILYAFSSGAANNGSAFGGLNANTNWYNTAIGAAMLFGRAFDQRHAGLTCMQSGAPWN